MQIFNLGFGEILFVLLIAVIVLGPERIAASSRRAGRFIRAAASNPVWRDILATTRELREIPNQIMEETGLKVEMEEIQSGISTINHEITGELDETRSDLPGLPAEILPTESPSVLMDMPESFRVPTGNPFRWSESRKLP
jgi:sec-independent protein translocase protein TatB